MNTPEILSFSFQERYLSRKLIQSRKHLIDYIKLLSKIHNIKPSDIIFNHDYEDYEDNGRYKDNFKLNGSYDFLKEND